MSPELQSPGLESIWSGEGDKEVYHESEISPDGGHRRVDPEQGSSSSRMCGMKKRTFYVLLVLGFVIIVGLGAGLGAGLGTKHSSSNNSTTTTPATSAPASSDYSIGGALNQSYYSTSGAFNGSGIALASQSFTGGGYGELTMYYQHHSGQIRYQTLQTDGSWIGGTYSEIVAVDAKNSTPLSAVSFVVNGSSQVRYNVRT